MLNYYFNYFKIISGQELVDWLHEHVEDISDRKAARQYAASLLHNKLIRHVVSKLTFNEKCYYVFEGLYSLTLCSCL